MEQRAKEQVARLELNTIVVAIDFSVHAEKALRYASAFALRFGGRLVLVHVIETAMPTYDLGYVSSAVIKWEEEIQTRLAEKLFAFAAEKVRGGIIYSCVTRVGEATAEIIDLANEHDADLIVMGTHGRTGLKHMFMGSVAEKTVRCADRPVLIVRQTQREFLRQTSAGEQVEIHQIITPTDFSETAEDAIQFSEMLASALQARLNILHVVPNHYPLGDYDAEFYPQLEAEMVETARRRFAEQKERYDEGSIAVFSDVVHGEPRNEILQFAEKQSGDLLVIGTRGNTGLKHLLLGSTAEYVVRHGTCAIITIPHRKPERRPRNLTESKPATV